MKRPELVTNWHGWKPEKIVMLSMTAVIVLGLTVYSFFNDAVCKLDYMASSVGQARGSVVVKELRYKPEGCGFETRWGELVSSIYLILPAALGPGVHSASNRNEYQKKKIMFLGIRAWSVRKADKLTAIYEPIV
jgi:hypothetical protein